MLYDDRHPLDPGSPEAAPLGAQQVQNPYDIIKASPRPSSPDASRCHQHPVP